MPYITTAEQIGMEKGLAQGLTQGLAQGLAAILQIKFGEAGQKLRERANQIQNLEALQKLMAELMHAQSVLDAERLFDEIETPAAN